MTDSTQTLPMSPPDYGQWLEGLSINLLVRDLAKALHFQREVLGTTIIYYDPDLIAPRVALRLPSEGSVPASATVDKLLRR